MATGTKGGNKEGSEEGQVKLRLYQRAPATQLLQEFEMQELTPDNAKENRYKEITNEVASV